MDTKVCSKCGVEKPLTAFTTTDRKYGYRKASCKVCENARVRAYYVKNAEYRRKTKERALAYDRAHPEKRRVYGWRWKIRKMGITPEQYYAMFEAQGRCCALCGAADHGRNGKSGRHDGSRVWRAEHWNVDHDHKTGRVRGLLCQKCNVRLGAYEGLIQDIGEEKVRCYLMW